MTVSQIQGKGMEDLQDIRAQAKWEVSSCKPGYGIDCLFNDDFETFWQTDGDQPHFVNLVFYKIVKIKVISMYTMLSTDESYTPQKVLIRAGTSPHDLQTICTVTLEEPNGWTYIPLSDIDQEYIVAQFIQIQLISNYMNGKDTRIRQIGIYGMPNDRHSLAPLSSQAPTKVISSTLSNGGGDAAAAKNSSHKTSRQFISGNSQISFSSNELQMFEQLR